MASAEREAITGVWGGAPSGVQGQSRAPGQGGKAPLKLKAFCLSQVQMGRKFADFCYVVNCSNMLFGRPFVYKSSAVGLAEMGDRLATIDIGRILGAVPPFFWGGGARPHVTQCRLRRGLPLYRVVT